MNIDLDLTGKTAVVGGASRGIGRAVALTLASAGCRIIAVARTAELLDDLVAELPGDSHRSVACDFDQPQDAVRAIAKGALTANIVINNTGGPPGGPIAEADTGAFEQTFRRHVVVAQKLLQALLPGMRRSGYGRVINVISTSVYEPIVGLGVSNTIRGAMASWAKTMALELGAEGITVNNVLPGFTATGRLDSLIAARAKESGATEADVAAAMRAQVPLGRFAKAEETAAMVGFLASPAGAYISGQSIAVDGARTRSI